MSRKFGESKVPTTPQNGFNVRGNNRDSTIKHMFYNWDQEMEIIGPHKNANMLGLQEMYIPGMGYLLGS